jgi:hypothetical protein
LEENKKKDRQNMYNNDQEKSTQAWNKQPASQGYMAQPDTTEISEEALENITGGMDPMPHPFIPNAYLYPSRGLQSQRPTATLITNHPSLPLHAEVMSDQQKDTVWQHTILLRTDGKAEHHYDQVDLTAGQPSIGMQPPLKRQSI